MRGFVHGFSLANALIILLLAGILITLLGAWSFVGKIAYILGLVFAVLFGLFAALFTLKQLKVKLLDPELVHIKRSWEQIGLIKFLRKRGEVRRLTNIIMSRRAGGYDTSDYEAKLAELKSEN